MPPGWLLNFPKKQTHPWRWPVPGQLLCIQVREAVGVRVGQRLSCSRECPANSHLDGQPTFHSYFLSELGAPSGAPRKMAPLPATWLSVHCCISHTSELLLPLWFLCQFNPICFLPSRELALLMSPPAHSVPRWIYLLLRIFPDISIGLWVGGKDTWGPTSLSELDTQSDIVKCFKLWETKKIRSHL